jgi:hypothetical protein
MGKVCVAVLKKGSCSNNNQVDGGDKSVGFGINKG